MSVYMAKDHMNCDNALSQSHCDDVDTVSLCSALCKVHCLNKSLSLQLVIMSNSVATKLGHPVYLGHLSHFFSGVHGSQIEFTDGPYLVGVVIHVAENNEVTKFSLVTFTRY